MDGYHGEAFRDKQRVMFSLSIQGLERAGVEAGSRFIENLLEGWERDIEQLLDDTVVIFVYPNPDGWVAKHPNTIVPGKRAAETMWASLRGRSPKAATRERRI